MKSIRIMKSTGCFYLSGQQLIHWLPIPSLLPINPLLYRISMSSPPFNCCYITSASTSLLRDSALAQLPGARESYKSNKEISLRTFSFSSSTTSSIYISTHCFLLYCQAISCISFMFLMSQHTYMRCSHSHQSSVRSVCTALHTQVRQSVLRSTRCPQSVTVFDK